MVIVQTYLFYSIIPVLVASFFLAYQIVKNSKISKRSSAQSMLLNDNMEFILRSDDNHEESYISLISNQELTQLRYNSEQGLTNHQIQQSRQNCQKKKNYLKFCDSGLDQIRGTNKIYGKNQFMNKKAVKRERIYRRKIQKLHNLGFHPTNLATIYEQAQY